MNRQFCCGQRVRARVIDGELVEVPHLCQSRDKEPDWVEFQGEQVRRIETETR